MNKVTKLKFLLALIFVPRAFAFELSELNLAVGANLEWNQMAFYGNASGFQFSPEGVAYTYLPVLENIFVRGGARLFYTSPSQQEMPLAVRMEETTWGGTLEAGLLYEWYVIPSLTTGLGFARRSIALKTAAPVVAAISEPSRRELLSFTYLQLGLGFPVIPDRIVVEPLWRYSRAPDDSRLSWGLGVEVTVRIL